MGLILIYMAARHRQRAEEKEGKNLELGEKREDKRYVGGHKAGEGMWTETTTAPHPQLECSDNQLISPSLFLLITLQV